MPGRRKRKGYVARVRDFAGEHSVKDLGRWEGGGGFIATSHAADPKPIMKASAARVPLQAR